MLKREQLVELRPLLQDPDVEVVRVGLKVIQSRKDEAADVAEEVARLLTHGSPAVRLAAMDTLQALNRLTAEKLPDLSQQLLKRWSIEVGPPIQKALAKLLQSQLNSLNPERMRQLLPSLLEHQDSAIKLVGLEVVQARGGQAAQLAGAVIDLLNHDDSKVREATLAALNAIGPTVERTPRFYQRLLHHWSKEENDAVKQALTNLLETRLSSAKKERLKETLPDLLRHKDPAINRVALKVVQDRKEVAADSAEDVAALLSADNSQQVRDEALAALKALGTAAGKAVPKMFELLRQATPYQRPAMALTIASMVESNDYANVRRLVPYLVKGLHPRSLKDRGKAFKPSIDRALLKFGQSTVDSAVEELQANRGDGAANSIESAKYRQNLYAILVELGKDCRSKENYKSLDGLVKIERTKTKFDQTVTNAAVEARKAMEGE